MEDYWAFFTKGEIEALGIFQFAFVLLLANKPDYHAYSLGVGVKRGNNCALFPWGHCCRGDLSIYFRQYVNRKFPSVMEKMFQEVVSYKLLKNWVQEIWRIDSRLVKFFVLFSLGLLMLSDKNLRLSSSKFPHALHGNPSQFSILTEGWPGGHTTLYLSSQLQFEKYCYEDQKEEKKWGFSYLPLYIHFEKCCMLNNDFANMLTSLSTEPVITLHYSGKGICNCSEVTDPGSIGEQLF